MVASTMLSTSAFAVAVIRSCGAAFVAKSRPMSARRSAPGAGHGLMQPSTNSKSELLAPPTWRGEAILRTKSSSSLRSTTTALRPLVVCGPSGVGKGTIISRYMEINNESMGDSKVPKFEFSVSHTTRQPRSGEVNGVHYHFVTREFMLEKIELGSFFIEHAEVHGNLYGTSFQSIFDVSNVRLENGVDVEKDGGNDRQCLLDIDVEGVRSIKDFQTRQQLSLRGEPVPGKERSTHQNIPNRKDAFPPLDAKFIFIAPPSLDTLKERLAGRGTETPETLERRFQNAKAELEYGMDPGNFDAVVVNDDLDRACAEFAEVVEEMYAS